MNRARMMQRLAGETFDVLVVGGGATGLGAAVDAASRGLRTALVEAADFASGTSSRSTKLIHGGVRYLAQGKIALVREALRERTILRNNAPHLVHDLTFVVPAYNLVQLATLTAGLKVYDALAGHSSFGRSRRLSRAEARDRIPQLSSTRLHGAVEYHDGQFDDARLAITLAQTAAGCGAAIANYARAIALLRVNDRICGATVEDRETGDVFPVQARVVINAGGIFADTVRQLDDASSAPLLRFSRGSHITVPLHALGSSHTALLVPKTRDGRVLFAIPWHERVVIGTTEIAVNAPDDEPQPSGEEIAYLVATVNRYLQTPLTERDVLATFAGIRPLVDRSSVRASRLSREHFIEVSASGLVTVTGGKWTTYRKMAEDAMDRATAMAAISAAPSSTERLELHGAHGTDAAEIAAIAAARPALAEKLHPAFPYTKAHVVYAIREEMARTVDDVLSRRTRATFLDSRAARECVPAVETLLADEAVRR